MLKFPRITLRCPFKALRNELHVILYFILFILFILFFQQVLRPFWMTKSLLSKNNLFKVFLLNLSNGPDKKERTKHNEHVGMQKNANFIAVSTILLIGLDSEFSKSA